MKQKTLALSDRERFVRRGVLLEYFTIGWNLLKGLLAVGSGVIAGSPSLVGCCRSRDDSDYC